MMIDDRKPDITKVLHRRRSSAPTCLHPRRPTAQHCFASTAGETERTTPAGRMRQAHVTIIVIKGVNLKKGQADARRPCVRVVVLKKQSLGQTKKVCVYVRLMDLATLALYLRHDARVLMHHVVRFGPTRLRMPAPLLCQTGMRGCSFRSLCQRLL
jgi:hypothetical protein